jgi:hypothetical protein
MGSVRLLTLQGGQSASRGASVCGQAYRLNAPDCGYTRVVNTEEKYDE